MRIEDTSTPVVVLRSPRNTALGVARSLGRLGVPVYAVDSDRLNPVFFSRWSRERILWNIDAAPEAESVAFLKSVAQRIGGRPILIPATDRAAVFVSDCQDALQESFRLPEQPAGLPRALASKRSMYYLAKTHGVPTAETAFPKSRSDVLRLAETMTFPILLKGEHTTEVQDRSGQRMKIVHDRKELLAHYELMENPQRPSIMLQEYIPGGDDTIWMFDGYCNRESECVAAFTGQKLREFPVHFGPTSLGICRTNATVEEITRRFLKAIGYRGIVDMGYRYDARDGTYKLLDVNPRLGATFRLFVAENGLDVARAMYLDLTRQPVPASAGVENRKWMIEDLDLFASAAYFREGSLTLRQWAHSLKGVKECACFALDDPLPAAATVLMDLRPLLALAGKRSRVSRGGGPSIGAAGEEFCKSATPR